MRTFVWTGPPVSSTAARCARAAVSSRSGSESPLDGGLHGADLVRDAAAADHGNRRVDSRQRIGRVQRQHLKGQRRSGHRFTAINKKTADSPEPAAANAVNVPALALPRSGSTGRRRPRSPSQPGVTPAPRDRKGQRKDTTRVAWSPFAESFGAAPSIGIGNLTPRAIRFRLPVTDQGGLQIAGLPLAGGKRRRELHPIAKQPQFAP